MGGWWCCRLNKALTMRLIDVDDLGVGRCSKDVLSGWNGLLGLIEKAPTVDAVPKEVCRFYPVL